MCKDEKKATEAKVEDEKKLTEEELDKASGGFYPWRPTEKGGRQYPLMPEYPD